MGEGPTRADEPKERPNDIMGNVVGREIIPVMKQECTEIEILEAFEKCCDKLMSFLVDDVLRGDIKLKSFLEDAGLTLQPC